MGEPADWYWRDSPSFANIWTSYYTDHEPESAFVAELEGHVVGYLLGCVDTNHGPSPVAALTREAIRRVLFARRGTAGFLWRSVWDTVRDGGVPAGELNDPRWPSHLHTNLDPVARGRGVGTRLMQAWFARLRSVGSPGCHLGTLHENRTAIAFFERVGFSRYGTPVIVPGMRLRSGARMHLQLMVRPAPADASV
jgi:ribosomal protein S18 acetylase RimI-like enzyme